MQPLRLGIIGLGYWGRNYLRILRERRDVSLAAICDADPSRLHAWHSQLPGVSACTDHESLFRNNLDGVIITTPASTHYSLVRCALEHRIPVLVEKPLTLNSLEAETISDLAEKYRIPLIVGHTYLFSEPIRHLRQLINQGTLGELSYVHSLRLNFGIVRQDCDVVWDLAPHDVAILLYLLHEEPIDVTAITVSKNGRMFSDHAVISLRFPSGVEATITVSWFWPEKIRKLTLVGALGAACYDDKGLDSPLQVFSWPTSAEGSTPVLNYPGERLSPNIIEFGKKEPLAELLEHFLTCIRNHDRVLNDGPFASQVVQILEKITQSVRKGGDINGPSWKYRKCGTEDPVSPSLAPV